MVTLVSLSALAQIISGEVNAQNLGNLLTIVVHIQPSAVPVPRGPAQSAMIW